MRSTAEFLAAAADLSAHLATTSDVAAGARALLAELGAALGASAVRLELAEEAESLAWEPVPAPRADASQRFPVSGAGATVGTLVVLRGHLLGHDETALVGVAANLLGIAFSRARYLHTLEREVTARVREVANQRAFIECIVDSLPVGLYVVDREYRIHAWNRKRESGLQGVARTDAIGRTIFEVLNRQPAARLKQEFDEVFETGTLQQFQMETDAFAEPRTFRISKIPMRMGADARVTHVITVGEDITDLRAAFDRSAQSEKLAALGQLAAGVMHEINNPLATIAACAETLALQQAGGAESPNGKLLHIIDLEVERCKKIVNGLLDFSRPKAGGRELFDLDRVAQQAIFLLRHHPRFKRIQLVTELAPAGAVPVVGDVDQLVQVLIALAMNAIDATPEGSRVFIRTRVEPAAGGALAVLEVADEGPGVPRALQAKVFEPFFTTKPPGQGTGLGLAICYGIVTEHGGTLELVSTEGTGATFRVSLPLQQASA